MWQLMMALGKFRLALPVTAAFIAFALTGSGLRSEPLGKSIGHTDLRTCTNQFGSKSVALVRYGVRQRACVTSDGIPGILTFRGYGHNRRCACVGEPPPPQPRSAKVALHMQARDLAKTGNRMSWPASFHVLDNSENHITVYFFGLPFLKDEGDIFGYGQAQIQLLADRVRVWPERIWVRSASYKFFERIIGDTRTEMIPDQPGSPLEFDLESGELLNTTTVTLRTTNYFYTEENPLMSRAEIGGSFDLPSGKFFLTLGVDFL